MYGVRYLGYSYTNCAWYAFPYEALEVFTIAMLQVATADFIRKNAPNGSLATLTGIAGGAHHGFGKGVGGLAGGIIIEITKSTKMAFYYFSLLSFGSGAVYGVFAHATNWYKKKFPSPLRHGKGKGNGNGDLADDDDDDKVEPFIQGGEEMSAVNAITPLRVDQLKEESK